MIELIKKRQDELTNNYLVIRNQIIDNEKELEQKKEQLQKIMGAIVEFNSLIQLCEAEK